MLPQLLALLLTLRVANAYWLMGMGIIATERLDPIVNPGVVSGHVHSIMGGSNFGFTTSTAQLRQSKCTSTPIAQDKSNYWFPHLYFQWANGSFTSLTGGGVVYYLFSDSTNTTAFPDDFRMLSGDPTLRTYDASSSAQRAVSFLCLDFNGVSTTHTGLPTGICPSGVRAQINMPSCWDGVNIDSPTHNTHVAFLSGGPDSGSCSDPRFPVTLPRVFIEVYWNTGEFDQYRSQALDSEQPFVFSHGDATGYGYHADYFNGWDAGVLQHAVDKCTCNPYGDPTCCSDAGIFDFNPKGNECYISPQVDELVTGTLPRLPGANPVLTPADAVNGHVVLGKDQNPPGALYPAMAFTSQAERDAAQCRVGGGNGCVQGSVPGNGAPPSDPHPAPSSSHAASSSAHPSSHTTSSSVHSSSHATSSSAHSSYHTVSSSAHPSSHTASSSAHSSNAGSSSAHPSSHTTSSSAHSSSHATSSSAHPSSHTVSSSAHPSSHTTPSSAHSSHVTSSSTHSTSHVGSSSTQSSSPSPSQCSHTSADSSSYAIPSYDPSSSYAIPSWAQSSSYAISSSAQSSASLSDAAPSPWYSSPAYPSPSPSPSSASSSQCSHTSADPSSYAVPSSDPSSSYAIPSWAQSSSYAMSSSAQSSASLSDAAPSPWYSSPAYPSPSPSPASASSSQCSHTSADPSSYVSSSAQSSASLSYAAPYSSPAYPSPSSSSSSPSSSSPSPSDAPYPAPAPASSAAVPVSDPASSYSYSAPALPSQSTTQNSYVGYPSPSLSAGYPAPSSSNGTCKKSSKKRSNHAKKRRSSFN